MPAVIRIFQRPATRMHKYIRAYNSCGHTFVYTYMHAYIHTYIKYTHMRMCFFFWQPPAQQPQPTSSPVPIPGCDKEFHPQGMHACAEVYLENCGWVMVEPQGGMLADFKDPKMGPCSLILTCSRTSIPKSLQSWPYTVCLRIKAIILLRFRYELSTTAASLQAATMKG